MKLYMMRRRTVHTTLSRKGVQEDLGATYFMILLLIIR